MRKQFRWKRSIVDRWEKRKRYEIRASESWMDLDVRKKKDNRLYTEQVIRARRMNEDDIKASWRWIRFKLRLSILFCDIVLAVISAFLAYAFLKGILVYVRQFLEWRLSLG